MSELTAATTQYGQQVLAADEAKFRFVCSNCSIDFVETEWVEEPCELCGTHEVERCAVCKIGGARAVERA